MTNRKRSTSASDLRRRAEERLAKRKATGKPAAKADIPKLLHELRVHQVELEMQNEELRRAQVELDAARARYYDLYDLAPVGYVVLSEKGLILEANLTAARLLGVSRGELDRQALTRFIHKDDQDTFYLHRKKVLKSDEPQACEVRMGREERPHSWAQLVTVAAQDEEGAPVFRVVMSDVTERRRAQDSLRESEESQRMLLEASRSLIYVIGHDDTVRYANPAALKALGRSAEQVIGQPQSALFPPEIAAIQEKALHDVEQEYILAVLARNGGNQTRTAEQLGIGSATLYRKLRKYGVLRGGRAAR
jgi:PAS domain S-box-containing protein